jgi:hypothetical protein
MMISRMMGARKPGPQGERAISRKTIAQGRPGDQAEPVVSAASFFVCWRAMGAAGARSSLRPLVLEGRDILHNSGAWRRENVQLRLHFPQPRPLCVACLSQRTDIREET